MTTVNDGQSTAAVNEYRVYVLQLQNQVWTNSKDFREANPDYKPRKPVVPVTALIFLWSCIKCPRGNCMQCWLDSAADEFSGAV